MSAKQPGLSGAYPLTVAFARVCTLTTSTIAVAISSIERLRPEVFAHQQMAFARRGSQRKRGTLPLGIQNGMGRTPSTRS